MTSLLGRLIPLFSGQRRTEDLFTEAVARLFERRPELCLAWLEDAGLLAPAVGEDRRNVNVATQKSFVALEHHEVASRPDLWIEIHTPGENDSEGYGVSDVFLVESKIDAVESEGQLKRYAEHLDRMTDHHGKTLIYITRAYDPKDEDEVRSSVSGIRFEQLRWHDFYHFLRKTERDAFVEEIMTFMEEQGMSRGHRFSATDLMALSGVPRAFEILDETLGGEVRAELESFSGSKVRRETHSIWEARTHLRYQARASLYGRDDLFCDVGYQLGKVDKSTHASILQIAGDGYPAIFVFLEAQPGAVGREASVAAMRKIMLNKDWEPYNLDDPSGWAGVRRVKSLASLLAEEDHVAAVKRFFIESVRQLGEELTAFKKDRPDLPLDRGIRSLEALPGGG